jgi:hypothetical protein
VAYPSVQLGPDDKLLRFIETQQKLLDVAVTPALSEEEALETIAETIRKQEFKSDPRMSTDPVGVAIGGFDPVAYFTLNNPVPGQPRHFAIWNGAIWFFASAENRLRFMQDPGRYTPIYGGYCAACMALGHKVHADPYAWAIHENRLYLHINAKLRDFWLKNSNKYIKDADKQWSSLAEEKTSPDTDHRVTKKILALIKAQ